MLSFSWFGFFLIFTIAELTKTNTFIPRIYSPKGFVLKTQFAQKHECGHHPRELEPGITKNLNDMSDKCLDEVGCQGLLYDGSDYFLCSTVPVIPEDKGTLYMYSKGEEICWKDKLPYINTLDSCQRSSDCIAKRHNNGFCYLRYGLSGYCHYCSEIHTLKDKNSCKQISECRERCLTDSAVIFDSPGGSKGTTGRIIEIMTFKPDSSNEPSHTIGVAIGVVIGSFVVILIVSGTLYYRRNNNQPISSLDSPQLSIHKIYGSDGFGTSVTKDGRTFQRTSYDPEGGQFLDGGERYDSSRVKCDDEEFYLK